MAEKNLIAFNLQQILNGQRVPRISGSALKTVTWNVRSLIEDGKLENVLKEMEI